MQFLWKFKDMDDSLKWGGQRAEFLCLLAVAVAELFFFLMEDRAGGIAWFYVERYLTVPAMLFLGVSLCRKRTAECKRLQMLGWAFLLWFFVIESVRRLQGADKTEIGVFFCAYALFLPFAAVTQDGKRQRGLNMIAAVFLAMGVLLVIYAGLLIAGAIPGYLQGYVCWDGTRFKAISHPNICAALLMISMVFSVGILLRVKRWWTRGAILIFLAVQFAVLSLTNGRTTIVFTCALMGGIVFCALRKTGWKRLMPALLAGIVVMGGLFFLSGKIYAANAARLSSGTQQAAEETLQTQEREETLQTQEEVQPNSVVNGQGTWEKDMHTLNGRTTIWASAVQGLRENPWILRTGTTYVDFIVSRYNPFHTQYAHNSWLEVLYRMGLPGLLLAMVLTVMAVRDAAVLLWRNTDLWKSCIALFTLCLLGCSMLESYLFVSEISSHFLNFLFLMCLGYMNLWCQQEAQS